MNVLFLCSGNSARSIMAESILRAKAKGRVQSLSAGRHPTGRINPLTLNELARRGYPTQGLSSKSWQPFLSGSELQLDFVISVCELVDAEARLEWPGKPRFASWQLPAPGAVQGSDVHIRQAFSEVCTQIEGYISSFLGGLAGADQGSTAAPS